MGGGAMSRKQRPVFVIARTYGRLSAGAQSLRQFIA